MASYRKNGNVWEAQVAKLGVRKSKSFFTKAEAQNWAAKTEAEILAGKKSGVADKTFGQLLERYRDEVTPLKKGSREEMLRINRFLQDPICEVRLRDLDTTHFAAWRDRRLQSVSPASVLRERNTLSNACKRAVDEWKWMPKHPMKGVTMPSKPEGRDRLVPQADIDKIMFQCGDNLGTVIGRVGQAFLFAIETGMRAGEIAGLRINDLILDKRYCAIRGGKTAAAKRNVPLTQRAIDILNQFPGESVFDLTTAQIDSHFRKAKLRAGVTDLHFHDSRAEAITRLSGKVDILSLARMVGHKDIRMLQVYYRESAEDIAKKLT